MLTHTRRAMTEAERARLEARDRPTALGRLLFRRKIERRVPPEPVTDVYEVTVERCIVPCNQLPDIPVYFLDLGGKIMVLGGDAPYLLASASMSKEDFDRWAETEDKTFFARRFVLCGHAGLGIGFSLTVTEPGLLPTEPTAVPLTFLRLRDFEVFDGSAGTLLADLKRVGLAEPEADFKAGRAAARRAPAR